MDLNVRLRKVKGKMAVKKVRSQDRIPGILYGRGFNSVPVDIDTRALQKALLVSGDTHLIDLVIDSGSGTNTEKSLVKSVQRHPVTGRIQHIDFYRVVMTEKIEVEVPLALTGVPVGIKLGGVLEKRMDSIRVRCLPDQIPDKFVVDVAALDVGQSLHVSNLTVPTGVGILTPLEQVLAVVTEVKQEEVAAPVAAAAAATPEAGAAAPAEGAAAAPAEEKKEGAKEKDKAKGKG